MKLLSRYLALVVVAGFLVCTPAIWAEECCDKTAEAVKNGQACEHCVKKACCKETAKKLADAGEAKSCEKCAAKKAGKKKKKEEDKK